MSTQRISYNLRFGVWIAHGEKCWVCRKPIEFSEVHIDHIIPESLDGAEKLSSYLIELGLPGEFDLYSPMNFAPAHLSCNTSKGAKLFRPTPLIQEVLHGNVASRAEKALTVELELVSSKKIANAVAVVLNAAKKGALSEFYVSELKNNIAELAQLSEKLRDADRRSKPLLLAPGLEIVEDHGRSLLLRGPSGMLGARPKEVHNGAEWDCPNCGPTGWSGSRCIRCGHHHFD